MNALTALLIATTMTVVAGSAVNADIVYLDKIVGRTGWGLGDAPQLLTIQGSGQNTAELCATGNVGGALSPVSGISDGLVFQGNGATNAGNGQANPLIDANKFNIPGSLSWINGVGALSLFNPSESVQTSSPLSNSTSFNRELRRAERAVNTARAVRRIEVSRAATIRSV
jgi:hypothetical protein